MQYFHTRKMLKCLLQNWPYLLTYLLTYSIKQSPFCEANRFSASQEISGILWKPKVHYPISKSQSPLPILSQINPVYAPHPTSWRSILILSSHISLGVPSGLLPSGFPTKTLYASLLWLIGATCHTHLILLELIARIIMGTE